MNVGHNVLSGIVGVGAALTMNYAPVSAGQRALKALANGADVSSALRVEMSDNDSEKWHLGLVGRDAAVFETGSVWIPELDVLVEDDVVAVGSLMRSTGVARAMLDSWWSTSNADGRQRIQKALGAGRDAGGDLRGMNSASIMVLDDSVSVADVNSAIGDPVAALESVAMVELSQRAAPDTRFDAGTDAWIAYDNGDIDAALNARDRWDDGVRRAYAGAIEYLEAAMSLRLGWSDSAERIETLQTKYPDWLEFARRGGEFSVDFRDAGIIL